MYGTLKREVISGVTGLISERKTLSFVKCCKVCPPRLSVGVRCSISSLFSYFLAESFGLLNDLFPFPSILDAGYPIFDLHLADVLFDVILPSVLESSL
jgi:hypothetical protein